MEDKRLRKIFDNFQPQVPGDDDFMARLGRNLDTVEHLRAAAMEDRAAELLSQAEAIDDLRARLAAMKSRNRTAVIVAAVAGFIVGFLFSLAVPALTAAVARLSISLPSSDVVAALTDNFRLFAWALTALTSVVAALNAYDLTLYFLRPGEKD
ncbi:MAG: hypothetical protein K2K55_00335 [Duncaniella sp.]|nr:hypothetical protein [Duncaniella sp.]